MNCREQGDEVVMVGCRQPSPGRRREPMEGPLASQLAERRHQRHEWRFDLDTGETRERMLDDLEDGSYQRFDYGRGVCGSESHFALRKGAGFDSREDDGYVVTFAHDSHIWTSRCLVFDACDISQGPVVVIRMPRRFHVGFHALWIRGEDLDNPLA